MDINITDENIQKEKPSEIVCTFCMKPTCQDFANIQQKSDLLELLKKLNVDILPINGQIDWICYQCTYKLNCIRDYSRTWASCVTKNRINYYYRLGEKEMVRRLLNLKSSKPLATASIDGGIDQNNINSSNNENELKIKISSVRSIDANDIPKTITIYDNDELPLEQQQKQQQQHQQIDHNNENNDNNENVRHEEEEPELSVMYEKSESIILTESGRRHRRKKTSTPTLLTCKQCHRIYKRLSFLKKHERKHERDLLLLKSKSIITTATTTTTSSQNTKKTNKKLIKCKKCEFTFKTLSIWRKHYKIHQTNTKCIHCRTKFSSSADLEKHAAVCGGVESAKDNKCEPQHTHRYMTRSSQTKIRETKTKIDEKNVDEEESTSDIDSMYTKRLNNARDWIDNIKNNHENNNNEIHQEELNNNNNDDDDDDCQSFVTSFTRASSRLACTEGEDNDDDNEYDDLSELTRPSAPSKNTIYRLKKRNKETDILLDNDRKRFKSKYGELVECPERNCNFISTTLNRLMEHDLTVHDELPLHFCEKCEGRFVRHLYIKDHLSDQNPGRFICTKCEMVFKFECEFRLHLHDHVTLDIDNKVKPCYCKYCKLFFTNTSDYYNHLETERHYEKYPEIDKKIKIEDEELEEKLGPQLILKQNDQEDLFKDEMKNIIYEQLQNDIKMNNSFTIPSKIGNFISKSERKFGKLEKDNIKFKFKVEEMEEKVDPSILTVQIDDEAIDDKSKTIKFNNVQPYKSEIRIRHFSSPFRRRRETIFRRWKPHREPTFIKGGNYYDCSVRPFKNSTI